MKPEDTQEKRRKKKDTTQTNLCADLVILLAFLVAMAPESTGLPIHEWLGLASGGTLIVHLILHWKWVVAVTRKVFQGQVHRSWWNYILDVVLFLWFFIAIVSGVMESRHVLPSFGLAASRHSLWENLHSGSAETLWLPVASHLLLHWKWIFKTVKQRLIPGWLVPR